MWKQTLILERRKVSYLFSMGSSTGMSYLQNQFQHKNWDGIVKTVFQFNVSISVCLKLE